MPWHVSRDATARGQIRLSPNLAAPIRDVRDLALIADPSGTRPLMSFGYSAGHDNLMARPGIGSLTPAFASRSIDAGFCFPRRAGMPA